MIYLERMLTYGDMRHQFRIFRVVNLLHTLKAISEFEYTKHVVAVEFSRPVGLQLYYKECAYKEMNGEIKKIR